jgi:organic radical activating enzyme
MTYAVKECFLTLQGEGCQAGSRAVFLRFAGCNLWSGRERDRATAQCRFCDTDFVGTDGPGGGKFADAEALAAQVELSWGVGTNHRLVVVTGGEPMLQLDAALLDALHGLRSLPGAAHGWSRPRLSGAGGDRAGNGTAALAPQRSGAQTGGTALTA